MKKLLKVCIVAFSIAISFMAQAQETSKNYFQISPRVGYDFPTYDNNTPYIDYKGGLEAGISLDYYWNWFGIGADFDYIKNKPESTFPTTNLSSIKGPITTFNLNEDKITRTFYGIGPSFKLNNKTNKLIYELNLRAGLGSIKGGKTLLTGGVTNDLLNFHAGYNEKNVFSAKGQVRFTYLFNENFGVHAGAYYLRHFNVTEEFDTASGISAGHHPFTAIDGENFLEQSGPIVRDEPYKGDIYSVGLFAGITFKINKKANVCKVCGEDHMPHCCATCGCGITVTAKDKFTNQVLPNTDIVLVDLKGNIAQSGTTNSYGTVVFNDVNPNNYIVKGKLHTINLDQTSITKAEFKDCLKEGKSIQKEILYSDINFILKGNVIECNSPNGLEGVNVVLKDKLIANQKNTISDAKGAFLFHVKQASTYVLKGNKEGYFSSEVELSTTQYDRNNTLFIDFEMCIDPCGKAIRLDNINFDLAKWDILSSSISDLQKVIKLMKDNPTISVEMSSHTDARGSFEYNQDLSQKRAQSTVNYLSSQGIAINRLIARGAGESELLNKCADNIDCTENEHKINRRTEFKVVCPN